jgi:hypothetical protein
MDRHEELRRAISAYCSAYYASEENPVKTNVEGCEMLTIGHAEAIGLSELELPQVTEIFHDCEAIVWVKIEGIDEPIELDELPTSDLENILSWLEDNKS